MRQAITTKFLGPTNNRGARVKAIARKADNVGAEMSATVDFSYSGTDVDHARAAKACAEKYGWSGLWVAGGNVDGTGNVYVNVGCPPEKTRVVIGQFNGTENRDWFYVA